MAIHQLSSMAIILCPLIVAGRKSEQKFIQVERENTIHQLKMQNAPHYEGELYKMTCSDNQADSWVDAEDDMIISDLVSGFDVKYLKLEMKPDPPDVYDTVLEGEPTPPKTMSSLEFLRRLQRKYTLLPEEKLPNNKNFSLTLWTT